MSPISDQHYMLTDFSVTGFQGHQDLSYLQMASSVQMNDCTTTIYFRNNLNSSLSNNIQLGTGEEPVFGQMLLLREESDSRGKEKAMGDQGFNARGEMCLLAPTCTSSVYTSGQALK